MRRAHATSAAALALSVGFGGCRGAASQVDTFVHEAERVRVATTPACQLPTSDPQTLARQLSQSRPYR
jgi:hypothetical protein